MLPTILMFFQAVPSCSTMMLTTGDNGLYSKLTIDDNILDSLTETVASKHKEIKEMEDKVLKLISENEGLIEENDRIKRCAMKMDQEIKALRSQTN